MLELLLWQYKQNFDEDFPLAQFEGAQEFELINILYDCILNDHPYDEDRRAKIRIMDAPGMKK